MKKSLMKACALKKTRMIQKQQVGGWIVSTAGIEFVAQPFYGEGHGYFITVQNLLDGPGDGQQTWLDHLRGKNWFNKKAEHEFLEAFYRMSSMLFYLSQER